MSARRSPDHWARIASEIGIPIPLEETVEPEEPQATPETTGMEPAGQTPEPEELTASEPVPAAIVEPESEPVAKDVVAEAEPPVVPPPPPSVEKQDDKAKGQSARPRRSVDWSRIAISLGMPVAVEAEPAAENRATGPAEPSSPPPPVLEEVDRTSAQQSENWQRQLQEIADPVFLDTAEAESEVEVGAEAEAEGEERDDAVTEEADHEGAPSGEESRSERTGRPGRRRRRRRRGPRGGEEPAGDSGEARTAEESLSPRSPLDWADERARETGVGTEEETAPEAGAAKAESEAEPRGRRRRRRPGRSSEEGELAEGKRRPPQAEPTADDESAEDSEDLAAIGEEEDESTGRISHRAIPTWAEAIDLLIARNLESRAKNPNAGGNRGRNPRRSRDRG